MGMKLTSNWNTEPTREQANIGALLLMAGWEKEEEMGGEGQGDGQKEETKGH